MQNILKKRAAPDKVNKNINLIKNKIWKIKRDNFISILVVAPMMSFFQYSLKKWKWNIFHNFQILMVKAPLSFTTAMLTTLTFLLNSISAIKIVNSSIHNFWKKNCIVSYSFTYSEKWKRCKNNIMTAQKYWISNC